MDENNNNPSPFRLPFRAKLIALWNFLFEIIAGVPYICLMSWVGDDWGAWAAILGGVLFALAHTVAAVFSFGHYERKYRMDEWEYELLNVLPLFIISVVTFWVVTNCDVIHDLGTGLIVTVLCLAFGGYSIVWCGFLCAALGIRHKLERRRS